MKLIPECTLLILLFKTIVGKVEEAVSTPKSLPYAQSRISIYAHHLLQVLLKVISERGKLDTNLNKIYMVCVYPSKLKSIRNNFQALELGSDGYMVRNALLWHWPHSMLTSNTRFTLELVWVMNHSFQAVSMISSCDEAQTRLILWKMQVAPILVLPQHPLEVGTFNLRTWREVASP